MCTDVMENYSVRYQLRNSSGNYTTVQSSTTSVTLQGLTANAEYIVSVAAITSAGGMSSFTEATQFELLGDFCVQLLFPVIAHCHTHTKGSLCCCFCRAQTSNRCDLYCNWQ